MNAPDPILARLLEAVKATKRRRQNRRIVAASCLACALAAGIPFLLPDDAETPLVAAIPAPARPAAPEPESAPAGSTLAMVVWQNGVPCLEELPAEDLGLVQFNFGLQPVIAYPDFLSRDPLQ